jgi:hypothetical protein
VTTQCRNGDADVDGHQVDIRVIVMVTELVIEVPHVARGSMSEPVQFFWPQARKHEIL